MASQGGKGGATSEAAEPGKQGLILPFAASLPGHHGGMEAPPGYYTAADVTRALGITPGALRNLVYRGRIAKAGGTARYPWYASADVAALLAERRQRSVA